jgi:thioredoxin type arsenate reductase
VLPRLKVLFLCTKNSCRSQMAEGWARALHPDRLDPYSAGVAPAAIDPRAIQVMWEAGVDLSGQRPKGVQDLARVEFDRVITVCDQANESCPVFSRPVRRMHVGFADPPKLAANAKTEEERLAHYRRVRDEIRSFVLGLPDALLPEAARRDDLPAVVALVQAAGLPAEGIADGFPGGYSVIRLGGSIVGVAGLETYGDVGLLRSVAIASSQRGTGLGTVLSNDRLNAARERRLRAVYLLTTTAADFFSKLGFDRTTREMAPLPLQRSSEFASVCPSTAVCLVKHLAPGGRRKRLKEQAVKP